MINESELKDKFVKMCSLIEMNSDGEYIFFFDDVKYRDYELSQYKHFNILKQKMKKLILLLNEDSISLMNKDIETEIWKII